MVNDSNQEIEDLIKAIVAMGWDLAVPKGEFVDGMIIGNQKYINTILEHLPDNLSFDKYKQ